MTYNALTEEQAGKLLKLSRAKLVAQIDQLTTEKNQLESQTIPAMFDSLKEEVAMLGNDFSWLANRIIELGHITRTAYNKHVTHRVDLFPVLEYSKPQRND